MMGGKKPHGFTIFETMIFLAISGVLLLSAINIINGKQNKTEFSTGIRQTQNQLQAIISNVATGHYTSSGNFSCTPGSRGPSFSSVSPPPQGTNLGCQYVGEAIQFAPHGSSAGTYIVYPLAANQNQVSATSTPATSIDTAYPHIIGTGSRGGPTMQSVTLPYGITVAGRTTSPGSIGFLSLNAPSASDSAVGTSNVTLVTFDSTAYGDTSPRAETVINNVASGIGVRYNPSNGVPICFQSGSTNQYGIITIGAQGNPNNVDLQIYNGTCP